MKIELEKQKLPDDVNTLKEYSIKIGIELNESNKKILFLEEQINLLNQKFSDARVKKQKKKIYIPICLIRQQLLTRKKMSRKKNQL